MEQRVTRYRYLRRSPLKTINSIGNSTAIYRNFAKRGLNFHRFLRLRFQLTRNADESRVANFRKCLSLFLQIHFTRCTCMQFRKYSYCKFSRTRYYFDSPDWPIIRNSPMKNCEHVFVLRCDESAKRGSEVMPPYHPDMLIKLQSAKQVSLSLVGRC